MHTLTTIVLIFFAIAFLGFLISLIGESRSAEPRRPTARELELRARSRKRDEAIAYSRRHLRDPWSHVRQRATRSGH